MGKCPKCSKLINPEQINWVCPVCNGENINSSVLYNCAHCKFGPRLFKCPNCSEYFEGMLLMGTYSGKNPDIVPADVLSHLNKYKYKLMDIDFHISHDINQDDIALMGPDAIDAIFKTEFLSPIKISRYFLHTFFKDSNSYYWLHGFAYCSSGWDKENEEANALLSMRYPSSNDSTKAQIYLVDILL